MENNNTYLSATYFLDFENDKIQNLIQEFKDASFSDKEKAIGIYLKIRDGWRYSPYNVFFDKRYYRASFISEKKEAHCIDKSILLTACLRGLGLPARLHFAKVKNHIAVEKLIEKMGTNEMTPHGMVDIFLEKKWVKVSPAFNAELCQKCNVDPLEFDGENDSIFQEYNREGNEFMEYLVDYGHFDDLPLEFIVENIKSHYPMVLEKNKNDLSTKPGEE